MIGKNAIKRYKTNVNIDMTYRQENLLNDIINEKY